MEQIQTMAYVCSILSLRCWSHLHPKYWTDSSVQSQVEQQNHRSCLAAFTSKLSMALLTMKDVSQNAVGKKGSSKASPVPTSKATCQLSYSFTPGKAQMGAERDQESCPTGYTFEYKE